MDFNYSDEDEAFRREFRTWLEANAPDEPMQRWRADSSRTKTTGSAS
jgi:hypothetical protein